MWPIRPVNKAGHTEQWLGKMAESFGMGTWSRGQGS